MTPIEPPPIAPPSPPRIVTARASGRAWSEPRVRFWWMAAGVLLVVGLFFASQQSYAWWSERSLVLYGTPATARVIEVEGYNRPDRVFGPAAVSRIEYALNGTTHRYIGPLNGNTTPLQVNKELAIRVDPDNPMQWTLRTEPPTLAHQLIGGILVLPILALGLAAALVQRAVVLRAWKNNPAIEVKVIDAKQSPVAPLSRLIRCTPAKVGDRRMISVYVPHRVGSPEPGQLMWVIPLGAKSAHALVVEAFVD